jgi:hypothetical protein
MNEEEKNYGYADAPDGRLRIMEYVKADYTDGREAYVATLEDGTYVISIMNPDGSERMRIDSMRLTKDSLIAVLYAASFFWKHKQSDLMDGMLRASISTSDNMQLDDGPRVEISSSRTHYMTVNDGPHKGEYRRDGEDAWSVRYGESWESLYTHADQIEAIFKKQVIDEMDY